MRALIVKQEAVLNRNNRLQSEAQPEGYAIASAFRGEIVDEFKKTANEHRREFEVLKGSSLDNFAYAIGERDLSK